MFTGDTPNKKAAGFLCSLGAGSCQKKEKETSTLSVCAYSTSDHALMGWYPKGFWLNEFPQYLPALSK